MKGRGGHLVPLSRQAVATLRELQALTGRAVFMFPAPTREGYMSNNTMLFCPLSDGVPFADDDA
jgi:integrase